MRKRPCEEGCDPGVNVVGRVQGGGSTEARKLTEPRAKHKAKHSGSGVPVWAPPESDRATCQAQGEALGKRRPGLGSPGAES